MRYFRSDPLMQASSQFVKENLKKQRSYFLNFEINREVLVNQLFKECCLMWNIDSGVAVLTDEYLNIISLEAQGNIPVWSLIYANN